MAATGGSKLPIDKGYSWVVCAGASVTFFVTMGVSKSLGVLLMEFQDHFKSDPSLTSLTVALVAAGFFMFVFFSNTLGLFFGNRNVAIGGAVLSFLSMLVTAFAPNIIFVVITLGLLSGISYSALFGPPLIILSSYFAKRRALATGLAVAGGSLGQLSIPLLFNFLVQHYGFQGGMLVFSGIVLQAVPACLLLRPPTFWSRKPRKVAANGNNTTASSQSLKKEPGCCTRFLNTIKIMLDKVLLKSKVFHMMTVSTIIAHLGYFSAVIFLPTCARSFFDDRTLSVILVSVMGVCDLAGRLLGGYMADLRILAINDLMGVSLLVPGIITVFAGIFPKVWLMFIAAIFLGSFAGAYSALLTPMIIEFFGLTKVSAGFGILTFLMGLLIAPFPTILSLIYKATGTYKSVLAISGALLTVGGTLFFLMRFITKKSPQANETPESKPLDDVMKPEDFEEISVQLDRKSELGSTLALASAGHVVEEPSPEADDNIPIPEADV